MNHLGALLVLFALAGCQSLSWRADPTRHVIVNFTMEGRRVEPIRGSSRSYHGFGRWSHSLQLEAKIGRVERRHGLRRVDAWPIDSIGMFCVVFEAPTSVANTLAELADDPEVAFAQPLQVFSTLTSLSYDDPLFAAQYGDHDRQVLMLHALGRGRGVRIGIVDTNVDVMHVDLKGQIAKQVSFVGNAPGDHGTAVAGVIAAAADNGEGIVGLAPDADVNVYGACRAGTAGGRCNTFDLAKALEAAIADRVDVLNLSLAGPEDPLLEAQIKAAARRGIAAIAAEDDSGNAPFPAALAEVIAVPADAASASRRGWVSRPEQLSTRSGGGYRVYYGSSVAAASATGLFAVLRGRGNQTDASSEVRNLLAGRCERVIDSSLRKVFDCMDAPTSWAAK